jgi:SAM-dependent methyltransferase
MGSGPAVISTGFADLHRTIEGYYSNKVLKYGPTPLGVDWSCIPTQEMRFVQLLKLCDFSQPVSINDLGCGYGALIAHIEKRHRDKVINYVGVDLSSAMIAHAKGLWRSRPRTTFVQGSAAPHSATYSVASGVFNVKLTQPQAIWEQFIASTLKQMSDTSDLGFAVNLLMPPPSCQPAVPELYYADPDIWRTHCERDLGADVEVLTGYGMREYTLLVRFPVANGRRHSAN